MKKLICIKCPIGCTLIYNEGKITGYKCLKGKEYGLEEMTNPVRVVTTTVKTTSYKNPRLSVKTSKAIPKGLIFKIMKEINQKIVYNDTKIGDVIIENILNTGANIIATQNIKINKA